MAAIDWDRLGDLEDWNHAWRVTLDSGLSERYVPGEGDNPVAMVIGEAPGAQEDIALRPFVGAAGRVLRDLMAGAGLFTGQTPHFGAANCWLTNTVHFRPPKNRTPTRDEIYVARSGLREEWLAIGKPRVIIPVGGAALHAVKFAKARPPILALSGAVYEYHSKEDGELVYVWPMIHPSFGLRHKSMIRHIESDWRRFKSWFHPASRWK